MLTAGSLCGIVTAILTQTAGGAEDTALGAYIAAIGADSSAILANITACTH